MRAWVFSDLHLHPALSTLDGYPIPQADVCICPGNISTAGMAAGVRLLGRSICPKMPVIFVPGTCDYKGRSMPEVMADARDEAERYPGLHLLQEQTLLLDGIMFVGATLWSDLGVFGDQREAIVHARRSTDYIEIKTSSGQARKRFSPRQSIRLHEKARLFIEQQLARFQGSTSVVVSHHAPSLQSMPHGYLNDPLAPTYASSLERLILKSRPDLWIHGGLWAGRPYLIGGTTVMANPRGFDGVPYAAAIGDGCTVGGMVIDLERSPKFLLPLSSEENESGLPGRSSRDVSPWHAEWGSHNA